MIFQDLITQIQTESRVKGDDTFIPAIIGLINELFKEAVQSQRPFELRKEVDLTLTAGTATVNLPPDFFIHNSVFFVDVDTGRRYELIHQDQSIPPAPSGLYGHPKSFEVLGTVISLKPFNAIVTGDVVKLVYYADPPEISEANLNEENFLTRLEPFIIRSAITRMRIVHIEDSTAVQALMPMASSAEEAFSQDKPIKKE